MSGETNTGPAAAGASPASVGTDQQLSEALVEGLRGGHGGAESLAGSDTGALPGDGYGGRGERLVMAGGTHIDEVAAEQDVVMRDKKVNNNHYYGSGPPGGGREPAPLAVSREILDEVRHAFVPPAGFDDLVVKQRLLILRVPSGRGGGTAGTRLLLDAGAVAVNELAPDTALRRLTVDQLEQGAGYLLRNAATPVIAELQEFEIGRLCEDLTKRGSWLVITVDPRNRFPDGLLSRYLAELGDSPAAVEVLTSHLRRRLGDHESGSERANEILNDAEVLALLGDSFDREDRVSRMAGFSRILADAAKADDFSLERIRSQLTRLTSASFETWFDGLDTGTRCFVIALATLPDFGYELVTDAATLLEKELVPPPTEQKEQEARDPFEVRRTVRLEAALARISYRPHQTRYGSTPMEMVRFIDPSLPRQVLNRVWTEYAEVRLTLLQWLRTLARHPVPAVRYGAAHAVGVFAVQAFDYVRRMVIFPWAASGNAYDRQAAALAVTVPAQDPALSAVTRRMVNEWHLDTFGSHWRNTAARAYGQLGLTDLDGALNAFDHLATETDHGLPAVISNSVTLLIVQGDEVTVRRVLSRLRVWTTGLVIEAPPQSQRAERIDTPQDVRNDTRARTFSGFSAFLTAAQDATLMNPVDDRPDATAWHGLLWLADGDPELHRLIAALWADALVSPIAHEAAGEVLTEWAKRVDGDSRGRAALAALMTTAVGGPERGRARATVLRHARSWASGKKPLAPHTSEVLTAQLLGKGDDNDG
ncbi:hypothetical protein AB0J90_29665 [Micromonospora sp. NPDC049523]|uniref:hypothetical protein n=1 Tax=Micromonospora sp. NPDC049523 TaxID=3155921 RepID=UPI00343F8369